MATESPSMTKTERNLWSAIVAEALAYLKYNAYAHRALEEGHPEVAQVFQEVAGAETIHGMNHLRVSGALNTTSVNLRTVTEGESKEYSTMYPKMIQDALDEGRQDAADSFALAMDRERHHRLRCLGRLDRRVEVRQQQHDDGDEAEQRQHDDVAKYGAVGGVVKRLEPAHWLLPGRRGRWRA